MYIAKFARPSTCSTCSRRRRRRHQRGLTQAKAAKLLGVSQPRISGLVRGRIELFSIDTLVEMLARLGVSVTLRTKRSRRVA